MNPNPPANEIVTMLTVAVRHALEHSGAHDVPAARDVAQILGFDGLDRALSVWRPRDPGTEPIALQLKLLCDRSEAEGTIEPFIAADADLGRLAVECGSVVEGDPGLPAEGTLGAADALGDLRLDDDASRAAASRVRLSPQVSAALRAAIDWLCDDLDQAPGARLRTEDSALELTCPGVNPSGLAAAAKVLAAVGGNLGPAQESRGGNAAWVMRVPIVTARETFLMVSQGDLDLALPWHAVLRVSMAPRATFDASIGTSGHPVLAPLVPLSAAESDYPIILIAHGLRRAHVVADRLVWRLPAETIESNPDPRAPGHTRCVRTEGGAVYRVADPARLLENVAAIAIPHFEPAVEPKREPAIEPPMESDRPSLHDEVREILMPDAGQVMPAPLGGAAVAALAASDDGGHEMEFDAVSVMPEPEPMQEQAATPVLDAARVMPLPLRALIAEDSISARLGLAQMLEGHGLEVHAVGTAAELFEALEDGPWALVLVDAELPDGHGVELLSAARERARQDDPGTEVVALVRDGAQAAIAIEALVVRSLHKPLSRTAVARLITELGLESENS